MTKKLLVAFSHSLTEGQVSDAKKSLGVTEIILLKDTAPEIHSIMTAFPASASFEDAKQVARNIVAQAIAHECEYLYFAGEPAIQMAVYDVIGGELMEWDEDHYIYNFLPLRDYWALGKKLTLIQSTTERVSSEVIQPDGTVLKTATFKHVQWRVIK